MRQFAFQLRVQTGSPSHQRARAASPPSRGDGVDYCLAKSLVRSQAERMMRDMDVVQREEFEAVKEMARKSRAETEALKKRIAELEGTPAKKPAPKTAAKPKKAAPKSK